MDTEQNIDLDHEKRLSKLETVMLILPEMRDDLKTLVADYNQRQGRSSLLAIVWTGVTAIAGGAVGYFIKSPAHH